MYFFSTSHLQCGEGEILAHSQWLAGVGQLQGTPAYTAELPLQTDWKLHDGRQFTQYTKPALYQVESITYDFARHTDP